MAYLLVKRGKFLEGVNYCSGFGHDFTWTNDEAKARRFADDEPADLYANLTKGRFVHRPNTRRELKQLARHVQDVRDRGFRPKDVNDRINARAALAASSTTDGERDHG